MLNFATVTGTIGYAESEYKISVEWPQTTLNPEQFKYSSLGQMWVP